MDARILRAALGCSLLAWSTSAFALNPGLEISQYAHTSWTVRDGFSKGPIKAITQTADGYLWLGTEFGLLRFDGVRAVPWQPPAGQSLPADDVWTLLAARDGALWIGTAKGLARWKDGRLTPYEALAGRIIWRLLEDRDGAIWASGASVPSGRLCTIRDTRVTCAGDDGRFGYGVLGLRQDRSGSIWLGVANGLWRWAPGPPAFFSVPNQSDTLRAFEEDTDGALLVATREGLRRFVAGRADASVLSVPAALRHSGQLLRDRDGVLWVATNNGLAHVAGGKVDLFTKADGLSDDAASAVFEDREGSIWAATQGGLDRFRDVVVATLPDKQGVMSSRAFTIRPGADGSLWIGTTASLARWRDGVFSSYRAHPQPRPPGDAQEILVKGFPEDGLGPVFPDDRGRVWLVNPRTLGYVERDRFVAMNNVPARAVRSIAQDAAGTVWFADQKAGLVGLRRDGSVEQHRWSALGRADFATALLADPVLGGMWIGFWDGGIGRFRDGRLNETHSAADGLGHGRVTNLRFAADRSLWVATEGGLSVVRSGRVTTLSQKSGLPCDAVHWAMSDDLGSLWLNASCGLLRIDGQQLAAWLANADRVVTATVFGAADGASVQAGFPYGYEPFAAKSQDGRLWFVGANGVNVVDPRRVRPNTVAPPVHVEGIVADHRPIPVVSAGSPIRLPALTRDLQIDYTALSLVAPEWNRFRIRLEGHDPDWQDVGTRRQAFYTNLRPGGYRFRVTASNNSGVWNETGATIAFSIAPAYYQTTWFLALSTAAVIALVWGAHRLRLRMVQTHEREISALNERLMKAQEQERIRIAGELHDGVMQDMLGVTMMLGTVKRRIGKDSDATATLDKAQQKLVRAGTDLRQLSHDLHPPLLQEAGLPGALNAYCEQFSTTWDIPLSCDADESARELSRGAALALFRILQEALGNAAKHAEARQIRVRLARSDSLVTLTVWDDGVGLDRGRLGGGGGLGLVMMRERAGQLNGTFDIASAPGQGTTITVSIPFR